MRETGGYMELAQQRGFESVAEIRAEMLACNEEIRALCAPDKCVHYGTSWICPPGCGDLAACAETLHGYNSGLLLVSRWESVDTGDAALLQRLSAVHNRRLRRLAGQIRRDHPNALLLSTGGCGLCRRCTYPAAPCRKPERYSGSLSAFGIDVGALCAAAGVDYAFRPGTLYYVGCILLP